MTVELTVCLLVIHLGVFGLIMVFLIPQTFERYRAWRAPLFLGSMFGKSLRERRRELARQVLHSLGDWVLAFLWPVALVVALWVTAFRLIRDAL